MTKKENILSAALSLLTQKGVHNTPMSAIAKSAGTGMGTIYNYFPNKELLINEIYVSIKEKEKSVILAFDSSSPIKTQFENYLKSMIGFFIKNPIYFKFMEQLQASPMITEESREQGRMAISPILELLEKGKQDRIIKNMDINEIMMFTGGAVLSFLRWYFDNNELKKSSIENHTKMVWDGIKE